MSKQGELLDLSALTNWQTIYDAASDRERRIVDYVAARPGSTAADISRALAIPRQSLNYELWHLAGRTTGQRKSDGLLLAERQTRADGTVGVWTYTARART